MTFMMSYLNQDGLSRIKLDSCGGASFITNRSTVKACYFPHLDDSFFKTTKECHVYVLYMTHEHLTTWHVDCL